MRTNGQDIYLPPGPHGEKTGLDDYIAQGHGHDDLLALATSNLHKPVNQEKPDAVYLITDIGIVWNKPIASGTVPEQLSNFNARIDEEILQTDGLRTSRFYKIKVWLNGNEKCASLRLPSLKA